MKRLALLLAAGAVLAAAPAVAQTVPATADAAFQATTLTLSAFGETRVAPDEATITLGVQTEAATAAEAMAQNRTRMNATVETLKRSGIAAQDIQTSGLNLNPQYAYEQNQPPKLTGYQASNEVTVRVRDLSKLGAAVDAVVAAGANRINGIAFGLADPRGAEDAARRQAVKALGAKAALYADATGHRVARLVNLSEAGGYTPQPPRPLVMARMVAAEAAPTPVEGGELTVRVDVTATYELAPR